MNAVTDQPLKRSALASPVGRIGRLRSLTALVALPVAIVVTEAMPPDDTFWIAPDVCAFFCKATTHRRTISNSRAARLTRR